MKKTVGLIGLGNAGRPIAERLLSKGYSLKVYDIRPEAIKPLKKLGATASSSPRQAAAQITITVLPSSTEVKAAVLSEGGVLPAIEPGFVLIDLSGTDPDCARGIELKIKERRGEFLGGTLHADGAPAVTIPKGLLSIVIGGKKETLEACTSILKDLAQRIVFLPEPWMPKSLKISVIMLATANTIMISEICAWLLAQGINPHLLLKVAKSTGSNASAARIEQFFKRNKNYGGALSNSYKDLRQALRVAAELNLPLPFTAMANQIQEMARAQGSMRLPSPAAIGKLYEILTGMDLGQAVLDEDRTFSEPKASEEIYL